MCGGVRAGDFELVPVIYAAAPTLPLPYDRAILQPAGHSIKVRVSPEWDGTAPVDRCIAPEVRALNEAGVRTLSACCGKHEQIPEIIPAAAGTGGILVHLQDASKLVELGYELVSYTDGSCCRYALRPHAFYPDHVEIRPKSR